MHQLHYLVSTMSFPNTTTSCRNRDPAIKVRGAISVILVVNSHYVFIETMDDKMATYRECRFPNCTNQYKIKFRF